MPIKNTLTVVARGSIIENTELDGVLYLDKEISQLDRITTVHINTPGYDVLSSNVYNIHADISLGLQL